MCARAMLNCEVTELRLVSPRDGWPNEAARSASSNAVQVIDTARVFESLEEALADCTFALAATARLRDMNAPVLTPHEAVQALHNHNNTASNARYAVVFGPERSGLTTHDVGLCDAILTFPLNPNYMSLNLSQAVLLFCYEWHKQQKELDSRVLPDTTPYQSVQKKHIDDLVAHVNDALEEGGFFTIPELQPKVLRNLRSLFQRMKLTMQEVHTIHGMIKAIRGKDWQRK